jgi:hypothetical protein
MAGRPGFDKGLESMVAEMLRVHMVDAVFSRDAVRNGLPPERVEALRREIVDRLKTAEEGGRDHRETVRAVIDGALGLVPGGQAASAVVQSVLERLVPTAAQEGRDAAPSGRDATGNDPDPTEPEER